MYFKVNGGSDQHTKSNWKDFRKEFQKDPTFQTVDRGVFKITGAMGFDFVYRFVSR